MKARLPLLPNETPMKMNLKSICPILLISVFFTSYIGHGANTQMTFGDEANANGPKPTTTAPPMLQSLAPDAHVPICPFISCVYQDRAGNFWFATLGDGICRYDGKTYTWFTTSNGLCDNYVWKIQEDNTLPAGETGIWFQTRNGVCHYNEKKISAENAGFIDYPDKDSLGQNEGYSYYLGNPVWKNEPGYLWFGAKAGVHRYNGKTFSYLSLPDADAEIKLHLADPETLRKAYWVNCTFVDKAGNLWMGTESRGVCRYDGINLTDGKAHFTWFTDKGLNKIPVRSIFQDKAGNYWFGTDGGGVYRYDGSSLTNFTNEKGLGNPDFLKTGKVSDKPGTLARAWTIAEDKTGNLWFGTLDAGAWRYDGNALTNFTIKDGLKCNTIYTIMKDDMGNLWFGTYGFGGGICRYDGKSFKYLTKKGFK